MSRERITVVLGTIGFDAHVGGLQVLRNALEQQGFHVVYLGGMVAQERFVSAAKESKAHAIWISSMYGMGRLDCKGLRQRCRDAGLGDILLYIGGRLSTQVEEWAEIQRVFRELGLNRVYPPGTAPEVAIADLRRDLELP